MGDGLDGCAAGWEKSACFIDGHVGWCPQGMLKVIDHVYGRSI